MCLSVCSLLLAVYAYVCRISRTIMCLSVGSLLLMIYAFMCPASRTVGVASGLHECQVALKLWWYGVLMESSPCPAGYVVPV